MCLTKYSTTTYLITCKDNELVGKDIEEYEEYLLKWMMKNLTLNQEWRSGVEPEKELKDIAVKRHALEIKLAEAGLVPFVQRKKREKRARTIKQPKNSQGGPTGPQE